MEINKKSQSAIEFMIMVGFIMVFFTVIFVLLNQQYSEKSRENDNKALSIVIDNIQDEIMLAAKSSDGYSRNFTIPNNINGKGYNVTIDNGVIYGYFYNNKTSMAIPIINVSGKVKLGNNMIKKQEGIIYIIS